MADPLAFRDSYKTAASVRAVKIADSGLTSTWSATVLDAGGTTLGTAYAAWSGPFAVGGVDALGVKLLDLEVLASAWTYNSGDGSWTSTARSQRA